MTSPPLKHTPTRPSVTLRCTSCGATYTDAEPLWACVASATHGTCGGVLTVDYEWPSALTTEREAALEQGRNDTGIWRYAHFLPLRTPAAPVTLGEGDTPLIPLPRWGERHGLRRVYAKLEYVSPTGSFKDRGAASVVAKAAEWGISRMVEDSSGNAGAAIAAYSARAGIPCDVYVPASAPTAKVRPIERSGANVRRIEGARADVTAAALNAVGDGSSYYAAHNLNPYFTEGMKTAAYEVLEALGSRIPDHMILPVGGGSLFVGLWRGCQEWRSWDWVKSCPRMHVAQSTGCAPLVAAYQQGSDEPAPIDRQPTVAGGIEVVAPPRGRHILSILRESEGSAVPVDDEAILAHRALLATLEGLDVEPTAAVPLAGLAVLAQDGAVGPDETVVVFLTGSGLKDPS
ncbi:MAG: threonine synthase [Dehalococcoidia bacterium]|nr:threonine synthase [Dehalococcoidia bacterium]